MSPEDGKLIEEIAEDFSRRLQSNYQEGFGVFPSALPSENYYEQVWTRDFALMGGNYFARQNPEALSDSLSTIFSHQRVDGALPLRVEKQYLLLKVIPGLRFLARPLFKIIEQFIRRRSERPVYEGQDFSGAEDTVPAALIAVGEFFFATLSGKRFADEHFEKIKKAIGYFRDKIDATDALVSVKNRNADWADSISRGGKLGGINVWWARSLELLSLLSEQMGKSDYATRYRDEYHRTKQSILEKLYNRDGAYFRAEEGIDRVATGASICGSLYLLDVEECVRVQETLKRRVMTKSGLKNFDPPYPAKQILWPYRVIGHEGYHNTYVWPWVTCQNVQVKIKIASAHHDVAVRDQYKREAVEDLVDIARLFRDAGGAYEIFFPDTRQPAITRWYKPPRYFMANMVAYVDAYIQLKELKWI